MVEKIKYSFAVFFYIYKCSIYVNIFLKNAKLKTFISVIQKQVLICLIILDSNIKKGMRFSVFFYKCKCNIYMNVQERKIIQHSNLYLSNTKESSFLIILQNSFKSSNYF